MSLPAVPWLAGAGNLSKGKALRVRPNREYAVRCPLPPRWQKNLVLLKRQVLLYVRSAMIAQAGLRRGEVYTDAGRCARRNDRICRTASGMRSFGSFHGNMLTSAFGASIADSIATA